MALIDFLIKHEDDKFFLNLIRLGLIPASILDRKLYYLFYLNERKESSKMQSIQNTCDEFNISQATVYNTIRLMREG